MTVPATAVYFTAYDQLKAFLCQQALASNLCAPMVAGALARCEQTQLPDPFTCTQSLPWGGCHRAACVS